MATHKIIKSTHSKKKTLHKTVIKDVIINGNTYKIIKELGYGMVGTVYLVSHNNAMFAYKIEHILPSEYKNYKNSNIRGEIDFSINFANNYPNQFIKLIDYDFIKDCKHKQKYSNKLTIKNIGNYQLKYYATLAKSPYCSRKIYTLIDTSLDNLKDFHKFNHKQLYSMLIQLYYGLYLMQSNGYIHSDLHTGNIGIVNTTDKYITILNKKIPTYGRIYKIIDYGGLLIASNYKKTKQLKQLYKNAELNVIKKFRLFTNLLLYNKSLIKIQNFFNKHKIQPKDFNIAYEDFKKLNEFKIISKYTDDSETQFFLLNMLYPEIYKNIIYTTKFKQNIQPEATLPIEDIIFIIQSDTKLLRIIHYFMDKLSF